jgi:hypothetical protein
MNLIEQVSFGTHMSFFKEGLKNRWNLTEHYNPHKPCLFFEVDGNINQINNHKSFKLIFPVNDLCCLRLNNILPSKNLWVIERPCIPVPNFLNKFRGEFEIKDYSIFQPAPLGDKIYAYTGQPGRRNQFRYSLIQDIQARIDKEIIIGEHKDVKNYLDINSVHNNFYKKCFLNLNFSEEAGLTSVIELAFMGIKTITNNKSQWECMIPWNNIDCIIQTILQESEKIGSTQQSMNIHSINDCWQNVDFWNNMLK